MSASQIVYHVSVHRAPLIGDPEITPATVGSSIAISSSSIFNSSLPTTDSPIFVSSSGCVVLVTNVWATV